MIDKIEWHEAFKELYKYASLSHKEFLIKLEEWKKRNIDIVEELEEKEPIKPLTFSKSEIRRYIRDSRF